MGDPTSVGTLERINQTIGGLDRQRDKDRLSVWRDHWWAEVVRDLDAIMATLAPNPVYRSYGSAFFGPSLRIDTTDEARAMYAGFIEAGISPGGAMEDERWAFADWGLTLEATQTIILPGVVFAATNADIDPNSLYRIRHQLATLHPFDPTTGLMAGETVYLGDPISFEPVGREAIDALRGSEGP